MPISDIDISFYLQNKVIHNLHMASFSCYVQESPLIGDKEKHLQKWAKTIVSWIQSKDAYYQLKPPR